MILHTQSFIIILWHTQVESHYAKKEIKAESLYKCLGIQTILTLTQYLYEYRERSVENFTAFLFISMAVIIIKPL